nr:hypothetical protein [Tanacetum cinerariifolium]
AAGRGVDRDNVAGRSYRIGAGWQHLIAGDALGLRGEPTQAEEDEEYVLFHNLTGCERGAADKRVLPKAIYIGRLLFRPAFRPKTAVRRRSTSSANYTLLLSGYRV